MPRNDKKKKFQKFLEMRRKKKNKGGSDLDGPLLDVLSSALVPLLVAAAYLLCWSVSFFTPVLLELHALAGVALCLWLVVAYRQAKTYWAYKTHLLFGCVVFVSVGLGSVWPMGADASLSLTVLPPAYTRLPTRTFAGASFVEAGKVVGGSVLHFTSDSEGGVPALLFDGKTIDKALDESGTSITVPASDTRRLLQVVPFDGLRRLGLWFLQVEPDLAPKITLVDEPEITARKTVRLSYKASDDYGVEKVSVRIAPTTSSAGVSMEPVEVALAEPATKEVEMASYADLTSLPWTEIPVTIQLVAQDGAGHKAWSNSKVLTLPSRTFRNPFARALIEEREKLAKQNDTVARDEVANVMAGIARQQGTYKGDTLVVLALRAGAVRLVLNENSGTIDAVRSLLWQAALRLEEGAAGKARLDLAQSEQALHAALARDADVSALLPLLARVNKELKNYFEAMDRQQTQQAPALLDMDWPLEPSGSGLSVEDMQNRFQTVQDLFIAGEKDKAKSKLAELQGIIENLRTTPPELTPAQSQMAHQVAALRTLVKAQRLLMEQVAHTQKVSPKGEKERKAFADVAARFLSQQQLLSAALGELLSQHGLSLTHARTGFEAMKKTVQHLQSKQNEAAAKSQAEALEALEKTLDVIAEQMRRSLAAKAP